MGRKTTKQLEEEQNSLRSRIRIIEDEIEERQEKEGRPAAEKKYVGKCFKTQNSYSGGESWPLYRRVLSVEGVIHHVSLRVLQFQNIPNIGWEVKTDKYTSADMLGEEISEAEFMGVYDAVMKEIAKVAQR